MMHLADALRPPLWLLAFTCVLVSCRTTGSPDDMAHPEPPQATEDAPALPTGPPETIADYEALAEAAEAQGNIDVAVAFLGTIYELDPTEARLFAWLDALLDTGQTREARRIAVHELAAHDALTTTARERLETIVADIPTPTAHALTPESAPSAQLTDAFVAASEGHIDDAIEALEVALEDTPEPIYYAWLGDLHWQQGNAIEARTAWSTARILFDERGAAIHLEAIDDPQLQQLVWAGEHLLTRTQLGYVDYAVGYTLGSSVLNIETWSLDDPTTARANIQLAGYSGDVVLSEDGHTLLVPIDGEVRMLDLTTGAQLGTLSAGAFVLATSGAGSAQRIATSADDNLTRVWTRDGTLLGAFELEGTTPTITRVYYADDEYGGMHDNILEESPSWPVALALHGDVLAVGGSDSKVRLFDLAEPDDAPRVLEFEWVYKERRFSGGNPDLNTPLDMRLLESHLVVLYTHGEIIWWNLESGDAEVVIAGACSEEETRTYHDRYGVDPDTVPTDDERANCGKAYRGALSHDASMAATYSTNGLRIRNTADGKTIDWQVDAPGSTLAWSDDDVLAMSGYTPDVFLWSMDASGTPSLTPMVPPPDVETALHAYRDVIDVSHDGRFILLRDYPVAVLWDVKQRTWLLEATLNQPGHYHPNLSADGTRLVVKTEAGISLYDTLSGELLHSIEGPSLTPLLSASNETLVVYDYVSPYDPPDEPAVLEAYDLTTTPPTKTVLPALTVPYAKLTLSGEGALLVVHGHDQPAFLYDTTTGEALAALPGRGIEDLAMAPDGSFVAWIVPDDTKPPTLTLKRYDVATGAVTSAPVSPTGWPHNLTITPDGAHIACLTESSELTLWGWEDDTIDVHQNLPNLSMNDHLRWSHDGNTIIVPGYDRMDILGMGDELETLATFFPLLEGEWLVKSPAGAVEGTAHAMQGMVTVVRVPGETLIFGPEMGWERFQVDGLLERALGGEMVAAPQVGRRVLASETVETM